MSFLFTASLCLITRTSNFEAIPVLPACDSSLAFTPSPIQYGLHNHLIQHTLSRTSIFLPYSLFYKNISIIAYNHQYVLFYSGIQSGKKQSSRSWANSKLVFSPCESWDITSWFLTLGCSLFQPFGVPAESQEFCKGAVRFVGPDYFQVLIFENPGPFLSLLAFTSCSASHLHSYSTAALELTSARGKTALTAKFTYLHLPSLQNFDSGKSCC